MLVVLGFGLTACGKGNNNNNVNLTQNVKGNGGLVAKKGEYIYFVNGYRAATSMNNKKDSYMHGALMMAKVSSTGIEDCAVVCDRLCGFESSGVYVFGDYIYFTSPCLEDVYDSSADDTVWAKERVDFNRVKIGTSKVERIYQSTVNNSNVKFNYYTNDSALYLTVLEKGQSLAKNNNKTDALYRINAFNSKDTITVAENVSDVKFADGQELFYTTSTTNNNKTTYSIVEYNAITNQKQDFVTSKNSFTIIDATQGYLFYSVADELVSSNKYLYRAKIADKAAVKLFECSEYSTNMFVTKDLNVVVVSSNYIEYFIGQSDIPQPLVQDTDASSINIISVDNHSVLYYDNANNIKCVEIGNNKTMQDIVTLATDSGISSSDTIEYEDGYIYFYNTPSSSSNKYLYRLKVVNNNNEEVELVGRYLDADKPAEPDDELIGE